MKLPARVLRICVFVILGFGLLVMGAVMLAGPAARGQETVQLVPQLGHSGTVRSVAYSQDGRYVLSGSDDMTALLWDVVTGAELRRFQNGVSSRVEAVAFSPDGRFALTGGGGIAALWDIATGAELHRFKSDDSAGVGAVAFSPDGQLALTGGLGGNGGAVWMWDTATGAEIRHFDLGMQGLTNVTSVAFSPDGRWLLTGSADNIVRLLDAASGAEMRRFIGHGDWITSVAFSPDGHLVLTASNDNTARIWETATGKELRRFVPAAREYYFLQMKITSARFSADGRFVITGSDDSTARLWDIVTGTELHHYLAMDSQSRGHNTPITSVAISPDGKWILAGTSGNEAMLWDAASGAELRKFAGHSDAVRSVAFSPDEKQILTGAGTRLHWTFGHTSGLVKNEARLWDLIAGTEQRRFQGNYGTVTSVAFSQDGRMALTGSEDNIAHLWDVTTGAELHRLEGHSSFITSIAFSHDGRFMLTGSDDKTARLWDAATGTEIRRFVGHSSWVSSVAFSHDDRFVLTGGGFNDGTAARLWDAATGAELRRFKGDAYGESSESVAFSPDDRQVATCSSTLVWLWDVATGNVLHRFQVRPLVYSVAFSPDGRTLLAGTEAGTVLLLDADDGRELQRFTGHSDHVNSLAFSRDGRLVLTGSNDGTTRIWETATGKLLITAVSFRDGVWAVTDAAGRFDTNDLDGNAPLVWVASSEPMRALPLEIFMRDYYTPRLLSRIMSGEALPPIRSIAEITNRVQPDVSIVSVSASKTHPGRADVVVHAVSHTNEKGQASGLQDLRLFRNGQMVGYLEGALKDDDFTFSDIQLPTSTKTATFTGYAFNSMNIKSATAQKDYNYEPGPPAKPRAFLLQIGVNHYQASNCELHGSVTDAEELNRVLTEKLTARGLDVKPVLLVSTLAESSATKEEIRNALQAIAAVATPDDVFFLSFSGHGYGDKGGEFYIFPSDVQGSCKGVDDAMLKQAISAEELTEWLRPIDAGEMTFVLDSCQSASSVEANDFKPGPMGSRGLGQLAYDKRMRILAASQSNQEAQERNLPVATGAGEGRTQGLLSYALTEEGLVEGKADWKPVDQKITVGEWLSYAADAVPKSLEAGTMKTTRGMTRIGAPTPHAKSAQIPAVFDFSKKDTFVLQ
jgi:WD40 repeat protein